MSTEINDTIIIIILYVHLKIQFVYGERYETLYYYNIVINITIYVHIIL